MKEKKQKQPGRPVKRNWDKVPASAKNTAEGKTRKTYIVKIDSIKKLESLAFAEGNPIGTELEICIDDRVKKYESKNGKL